ncbi:hypothetical protein JG688_00011488 [Phytophthora aleatoria]|uniref:Uncharacterized protein n=1 Tax=Phytophthora aleatoria TaxID=2496075 RepID=A0A8J5ICZ0_9STRA|nr:hypothetical protein JG688_00011488 [Phytophthora aleatoria]
MGCAVKGCQEGDELETDPCTVCGKLIHYMCAMGVFEGATLALTERICTRICVRVVYPSEEMPVSSAGKRPSLSTATSKGP